MLGAMCALFLDVFCFSFGLFVLLCPISKDNEAISLQRRLLRFRCRFQSPRELLEDVGNRIA